MTPKEKAKELYKKVFCVTPQPYTEEEVESGEFKGLKFNTWDRDWTNKYAKQCALICVHEFIEFLQDSFQYGDYISRVEYWLKVKSEINKL